MRKSWHPRSIGQVVGLGFLLFVGALVGLAILLWMPNLVRSSDDAFGIGSELPEIKVPARAQALGGEPPVELTAPGALAALARRFQPTLEVPVDDRFWPVSLPAMLTARSNGQPACIVDRQGRTCPARVEDLSAHDSRDSYLDLPAKVNDVKAQLASLGSVLRDPASAELYFHLARAPDYHSVPRGLVALQYWFLYPLNYQPMLFNPLGGAAADPVAATLANTNYHEGDFEHVAVLIDATSLAQPVDEVQPRYLWLARHDSEGVLVPWASLAQPPGSDHPVVRAAVGSHATYGAGDCGMRRRDTTLRFVNDWTLCGPDQVREFTPGTPLVDLDSLAWKCWHGHFGQKRPWWAQAGYVKSGPESPLRQRDPAACAS